MVTAEYHAGALTGVIGVIGPTLSGTAFGSYGEGFLRLSYANSIENIQKALTQIDAAVRKM